MQNQKPLLQGICFAVLAALGYASMPLLASPAYQENVTPLTLLSIRFLIAWVLCPFFFGVKKIESPPYRAGLLFTGLAFCYFGALKYIPSSQVALCLYLYPIWVLLGEWRWLKKRMDPRQVLGMAMSLGGIALAIPLHDVHTDLRGLSLGILSSLFYAAYILDQSRLRIPATEISRTVIKTAALTYLFCLGIQFAWGNFQGTLVLPHSVKAWVGILGLAAFSSILALTFFSMATRRVGASTTSLISTTEPIFTIALAIIFLGENWSIRLAMAALLVCGGAALFVYKPVYKISSTDSPC